MFLIVGMTETRPDSPSPSPVKEIVKIAPKIDINNRRRAKRTVTKTYQDDDGYLSKLYKEY